MPAPRRRPAQPRAPVPRPRRARRCARPASSSTSASCARATRCPRSARWTGSSCSAASRPRPTRRWSDQAALLRDATAQGVPVLGVCLGAQLLAHAHGGEVRKLARRHLDWLELEPLPAADGDPVLGALPPGAAGVHWNEDGFALPPGAVELLRSPARHGRGLPDRRALVGRAVPPRARRGRRSTTGTSTGTARSRRPASPRPRRAPPTASTCRASARSRRRSSAASPASWPPCAGSVCGHGRADLPASVRSRSPTRRSGTRRIPRCCS